METNEATMESKQGPQRVVEAEFRLPRLEEIELPKVDWEPVRKATEQVLLTGIGIGMLVARGIGAAIKTAYQAGEEAAERPGTVAHTVATSLRRRPKGGGPQRGIKRQVPVLPIDNYDSLSVEAIVGRLGTLSPDKLWVLREYELTHANRAEVLRAIDEHLG
jgi:hypothetical protein